MLCSGFTAQGVTTRASHVPLENWVGSSAHVVGHSWATREREHSEAALSNVQALRLGPNGSRSKHKAWSQPKPSWHEGSREPARLLRSKTLLHSAESADLQPRIGIQQPLRLFDVAVSNPPLNPHALKLKILSILCVHLGRDLCPATPVCKAF